MDEIQLCADADRGHVFTDRLLNARGLTETLFLGSDTMRGAIAALVPGAQFVRRERLSTLSYAGSKKIARMPSRSAIVAFSVENVYAIAELIRRQKGGCALVMGALSPRTRNAQVELFQSGEVDFLVATDAIGMGLNMDVDHVAFAGLRKFDGRQTRWLYAHEIGQIAGRAGRHLRDGTFGVTGEALELDPDLVEQVVEHRFDPVEALEWRNARLDFDTLPDLLRSLTETPGISGLRLTQPALDETVLRRLANDEDVRRISRSRGTVMRLWEACQLPDFEKTTLDAHAGQCRDVFRALTGPKGRLGQNWFEPRFQALDRDDGQIDQLSARLSGVRTLSYIANRPDWLEGAAHWRDRTRELEDRLSDVLHERLTARFVDRRTTALMQALNVRQDAMAEVQQDGDVWIGGHLVGHLSGIAFTLDRSSSALAEKTLRHAARQAVTPEVVRRLEALIASPDADLSLADEGQIIWNGPGGAAPVAHIIGDDPFKARAALLGDLGGKALHDRARDRVQSWLRVEVKRALRPLVRLRQTLDDPKLAGPLRGLVWRLADSWGQAPRADLAEQLAALTPEDRQRLKSLGIYIGRRTVSLPKLRTARAVRLLRAHLPRPLALPEDAKVVQAPSSGLSQRELAASHYSRIGNWVLPTAWLEQMARLGPEAFGQADASQLNSWNLTAEQVRGITRALTRTSDRARQSGPKRAASKADKRRESSPFAAIDTLRVRIDTVKDP